MTFSTPPPLSKLLLKLEAQIEHTLASSPFLHSLDGREEGLQVSGGSGTCDGDAEPRTGVWEGGASDVHLGGAPVAPSLASPSPLLSSWLPKRMARITLATLSSLTDTVERSTALQAQKMDILMDLLQSLALQQKELVSHLSGPGRVPVNRDTCSSDLIVDKLSSLPIILADLLASMKVLTLGVQRGLPLQEVPLAPPSAVAPPGSPGCPLGPGTIATAGGSSPTFGPPPQHSTSAPVTLEERGKPIAAKNSRRERKRNKKLLKSSRLTSLGVRPISGSIGHVRGGGVKRVEGAPAVGCDEVGDGGVMSAVSAPSPSPNVPVQPPPGRVTGGLPLFPLFKPHRVHGSESGPGGSRPGTTALGAGGLGGPAVADPSGPGPLHHPFAPPLSEALSPGRGPAPSYLSSSLPAPCVPVALAPQVAFMVSACGPALPSLDQSGGPIGPSPAQLGEERGPFFPAPSSQVAADRRKGAGETLLHPGVPGTGDWSRLFIPQAGPGYSRDMLGLTNFQPATWPPHTDHPTISAAPFPVECAATGSRSSLVPLMAPCPESEDVATLTFIRHYHSRGNIDLLNRGNLLRLFSHIPTLTKLSSKTLLWVQFKEMVDGRSGQEATMTAWDSKATRDLIFAQRSLFANWGIELEIPVPPKYPYILLGPLKPVISSSVLRGAQGGPSTGMRDWQNFQVNRSQSLRPPDLSSRPPLGQTVGASDPWGSSWAGQQVYPDPLGGRATRSG